MMKHTRLRTSTVGLTHRSQQLTWAVLAGLPPVVGLLSCVSWVYRIPGFDGGGNRWTALLSLTGIIGLLMSGSFAAARGRESGRAAPFQLAGERLLVGVLWFTLGLSADFAATTTLKHLLPGSGGLVQQHPLAAVCLVIVGIGIFLPLYLRGAFAMYSGVQVLHGKFMEEIPSMVPTRPGAHSEEKHVD